MKMRVRCTSAPLGYEHYEGTHGVLVPLALPQLGYQFLPNGESNDILLDSATGWRFKPEFPHEHATLPSAVDPIVEVARAAPPEPAHDRRERDKYDSTEFEKDLEKAIGAVRFQVLDARRLSLQPTQPHLPEGISMREAMRRVCESLVLRKLTGEFEEVLDQILDDARVMLIHKNAAYGDSALNPVRVFSKASLSEQLLVRLDDKASRLARGSAAGEDVAGDMLGYFLLVLIAEEREREQRERAP